NPRDPRCVNSELAKYPCHVGFGPAGGTVEVDRVLERTGVGHEDDEPLPYAYRSRCCHIDLLELLREQRYSLQTTNHKHNAQPLLRILQPLRALCILTKEPIVIDTDAVDALTQRTLGPEHKSLPPRAWGQTSENFLATSPTLSE